MHDFQVLFCPLIQNKELNESEKQFTFLILIELLIDDETISMSSDNYKHTFSSRCDIEVVCKGDTRVFDANRIRQFEHVDLWLNLVARSRSK